MNLHSIPFLASVKRFFDDSDYVGAVATPTGGNGQGYYGLLSRAESNLSGTWYSYNGAPGPPAGTSGGGMINSNPSNGQGFNLAAFEIHFDGTGLRLWGFTGNLYGEGKITLDGIVQAGTVAFHPGALSVVQVYEITGLPPGRHVLRFVCLDYDTTQKVCLPQYYQIL